MDRLPACIHGGEVFEVSRSYHVPVGEILDFSSNVNPLGASRRVLEAVKNSLGYVSMYPDSSSFMLRSELARYMGCVGVENLVVGNGSTEIIHLFSEVFVGRGAEAVIPAPTFGEYEKAVRRFGSIPVHVEGGGNFEVNSEKVLGKLSKRTRAIFLCNPNNPTSTLLSKDEISEVIDEAYRRDVMVFMDEDCLEFTDEGRSSSQVSLIHRYPNLFISKSFTKVFGLAGLRVGYGVACKDIVDMLVRVKIPWNVNSLGQAACLEALRDLEHVERARRVVREGRKFLFGEFQKVEGVRVYPPKANFMLLDTRKSGFKAAVIKQKMLKQRMLIRDCSSFRSLDEYFVRVAVKRQEENEKLVREFKSAVGG